MYLVAFAGLCTLNPFHLAMADQHKALANALRSLRGIHSSGGKKTPAAEKAGVSEAAPSEAAPTVDCLSQPTEGTEQVAELTARKRRKVVSGSSSRNPAPEQAEASGMDEVEVPDSGRSPREKYRAAVDKMPLPRRFAEMEAAGYEAVTYAFLQKWKEVIIYLLAVFVRSVVSLTW